MSSTRNAGNMPVSKRVYIQRDYSSGTMPKFQEKLPRELDDIVDPGTFQDTIQHLNKLYEETENMKCCTYWEGLFSCLTGYVFMGCMETQYDQCLKKVKAYLKEQNQKVYWPKGVLIKDPYPTGLRSIEIVIYNCD